MEFESISETSSLEDMVEGEERVTTLTFILPTNPAGLEPNLSPVFELILESAGRRY